MQTLFDLTLGTIKADPDEPVCMLAIDFWSTMAEEEAELLDEIDAANEQGAHAPPLPGYVRAALPHLVPVLLEETLTKQDEDADAHEWNKVHMRPSLTTNTNTANTTCYKYH